MDRKGRVLMVSVALLALVGSAGCVSKKLFRKNMTETEERIVGVESAVEANERRVAELAEETDRKIAEVKGTAERAAEIGSQAMGAAEQAKVVAERAARGKLLWSVTLSDDRVHFGFDEAALSPEAMRILDELVAQVRGLDKAVYLEIEGHTDNVGSEEYNYALGEKRAIAVRDYLRQRGIPLHAMSVISYGESKPVVDNATPEGRARNRRVVIHVLE